MRKWFTPRICEHGRAMIPKTPPLMEYKNKKKNPKIHGGRRNSMG